MPVLQSRKCGTTSRKLKKKQTNNSTLTRKNRMVTLHNIISEILEDKSIERFPHKRPKKTHKKEKTKPIV